MDLKRMLDAADETKFLRVGAGESAGIADFLREVGGSEKVVIVADENTWEALGVKIFHNLKSAKIAMLPPVILNAPDLHAEMRHVDYIGKMLNGGYPLAVGAGTINDMVKLAAERADTRYVCAGTAASMDGYNATGAAIIQDGVKQTFACKAPIGVLIDLNVIAAAPKWLNATGYADLAAKIPAGADWILADALGLDPIDQVAWEFVQNGLSETLAKAKGIRDGDKVALEKLVAGLLVSGFAMQKAKRSRPASGADHQFSHLWDMRNHTFNGAPVPHGFKVGIGTLCATAMYERLFSEDAFNISAAVEFNSKFNIDDVFDSLLRWPALRKLAMDECCAKRLDEAALEKRLKTINEIWPELRERLKKQLMPSAELIELFRIAGAPTRPEEIGVSIELMNASFAQAMAIRRRYTVLDLAFQTGKWNAACSTACNMFK